MNMSEQQLTVEKIFNWDILHGEIFMLYASFSFYLSKTGYSVIFMRYEKRWSVDVWFKPKLQTCYVLYDSDEIEDKVHRMFSSSLYEDYAF